MCQLAGRMRMAPGILTGVDSQALSFRASSIVTGTPGCRRALTSSAPIRNSVATDSCRTVIVHLLQAGRLKYGRTANHSPHWISPPSFVRRQGGQEFRLGLAPEPLPGRVAAWSASLLPQAVGADLNQPEPLLRA